MIEYCVDERHGTPCPQPCRACLDEGCDGSTVVADSPVNAAREAGWDEAYIEEMVR